MLGCVILAAGNAGRFGGNKLLAEFAGKPLIRRAFESVPVRSDLRVAVVTQYGEIEDLAAEYGFGCVRNDAPEEGISRSIRLGTEALLAGQSPEDPIEGILYLVADQPLLRRQTAELLLERFLACPGRIAVPVSEGRQGNPCVFPKDLFPALQKLQGDRGGKQIIRAHPERVLTVEVPARELSDVDTAQALEALR